jgi:hypothetical protein
MGVKDSLYDKKYRKYIFQLIEQERDITSAHEMTNSYSRIETFKWSRIIK